MANSRCSTVNVDIQTVVVDTRVQPSPQITVVAGKQGPPGVTAIGDKGFQIENLQDYDMLRYFNQKWRNIPQTVVTDGGNF